MNFALFAALGLLLFCSSASGNIGAETSFDGVTYKWTHNVKLPSGMEVNWIANDPNYVTFEMKSPTKGYASIGFSPTGGMSGADIYVGWVDSGGIAHLLDMYGTHNGQPLLDSIHSLELLGGFENENGTTIIFKRKWDTCDDEDFVIGDDTMRLIWATSSSDPIESTEGWMPLYHGNDVMKRGVRSTYIKDRPKHKKFPDEEDVYPENVKHVDLTVSNVIVPKLETYYHCKIVKFPRLPSKHHIIAHRPLIGDTSVPHVHHINVYKCHVPEILRLNPEDIFEKYVGHHGGDCYTEESPKEWSEYCFEFRVAIAVGSEGDILPEHIGDVIGDTDGPTYFRIEVHYENPQGKQLIDSSGIRVFYTPVLRQYEMAVLFAGHRRTPFLTIPPHQHKYTAFSFCSSECTKQGIPKDGIKIISVLLHAHLTGRRIILRHIRNGKELPPIAQDNHIDFNYQHYRQLNKEVTVLPGDELITECTFDTAQNHTFVYGGLSTRREMCESFIVFYPKSTLLDCRSQPEFYAYFSAIGVNNATGKLLDDLHLPFNSNYLPENMKNSALADDAMILENGRSNDISHDVFKDIIITQPKELQGKDVHTHMTSLNWHDDELVRRVQDVRKSGFHYMHCASAGGKKIHTERDVYLFPTYEPYLEPIKSCLLAASGAIHRSHQDPVVLLLAVIVGLAYSRFR